MNDIKTKTKEFAYFSTNSGEEVSLYNPDGSFAYMVRVTPHHGERFTAEINRIITSVAADAVRDSWKPINSAEDLPKEAGDYLWQTKLGNILVNNFVLNLNKYPEQQQDYIDAVLDAYTAWMPLPPAFQLQEISNEI